MSEIINNFIISCENNNDIHNYIKNLIYDLNINNLIDIAIINRHVTIQKLIISCNFYKIYSIYKIINRTKSYCFIVTTNEYQTFLINQIKKMNKIFIEAISDDANNYYKYIHFNSEYSFMSYLEYDRIHQEYFDNILTKKICSIQDNINIISIINNSNNIIEKYHNLMEYIIDNNLKDPFILDIYLFILNNKSIIEDIYLLNYNYLEYNYNFNKLFDNNDLILIAINISHFELFVYAYENNYYDYNDDLIFYSSDIINYYNNYIKEISEEELLDHVIVSAFNCDLDVIKWILTKINIPENIIKKLIIENKKQPIKNDKYIETNNYLENLKN